VIELVAIAAVLVMACGAVATALVSAERASRLVRELGIEHARHVSVLLERVQSPPLTAAAFAAQPPEQGPNDADIDREWAEAPFAAVPFDPDLDLIPGIDTEPKE